MSAVETVGVRPTPNLTGLQVLVLTSGHEALDGRVYAREAESLQSLGAEVTVVGKWTKGALGTVPVVAIRPASSRPARFLLQPWRCLWAARKMRPDIVHFHDAEMLASLPVARLLWPKARFVYDVHEDFANLMMIRDWFPAPVKPLVRRLTDACEKTLARLAHGVVAVTPPLAERFPRHSSVVAFNYATSRFFEQAAEQVRKPSEREYDLIHVGTLSRPRAVFLADVYGEFHRLRPGSRSMIFGADDDVMSIVAARLPASCEVIGRVPYERVAALLGNARVGLDVHPWMAPHLQPALAVKVCEYMASGCAVVASAMPVLESILRGSGLEADTIRVLRGGEPRDYAEAAVSLLESIDDGFDPGARLREFARKHLCWDGEADKIARFYLGLVGKNACAI